MIDDADDQPHTTLPQFTPVPRARRRAHGWTPQAQLAFIEALAETGSVRAACKRVGRSDHGAYLLRMHPEAHEFRRAWQAALDIGIARIEDLAMDLASNGREEPFYAYGKLVGTRVRYSERLMMFLLRNRAPHRFAAGGAARGLNAVDKAMIARLKKQWLAERLREEDEDEQKTLDELDQWLGTMSRNRRDNMSPRARAAYEEAERIAKEDGVAWMDGIAPDDEEEALALPPPVEEAEEEETPSGPRIRTLKDEGW